MQNNIGEARRSYSLKIGKEITQDMAAEIFGVSPSGYKKWEQGVGKLNGEILCAIADKYECSTDFLLCRTSDPSPYPKPHQSASMDTEESRMVEAFRSCTPRERSVLTATAETMADNGKAKNMDDGSAAEIGA